MSDCLFCGIAEGSVEADRVVEDDRLVAFRDINPQAPTHILVIPKRHIASARELGDDEGPLLGHMFAVIAQLAADEGLERGYRVVTNVGPDAGQSVDHLHVHLLGGRPMSWPPG